MVSRTEEIVDALPAVQLEHEPDVRKAAMLEDPPEDRRRTLFDVDIVGIEVPQKPAKLSGNGRHGDIVARRTHRPCSESRDSTGKPGGGREERSPSASSERRPWTRAEGTEA